MLGTMNGEQTKFMTGAVLCLHGLLCLNILFTLYSEIMKSDLLKPISVLNLNANDFVA